MLIHPSPNVTAPNAWGDAPTGLLVYHPNGFVSANMAATEPGYRPQTISWPPPNTTDDDADWAIAAQHALSYAGYFTIEREGVREGVVKHGPITVSSVPSMVGTNLTREWALIDRDDGVYLALDGGSSVIWWKKTE